VLLRQSVRRPDRGHDDLGLIRGIIVGVSMALGFWGALGALLIWCF
jgi:hypothetical protein